MAGPSLKRPRADGDVMSGPNKRPLRDEPVRPPQRERVRDERRSPERQEDDHGARNSRKERRRDGRDRNKDRDWSRDRHRDTARDPRARKRSRSLSRDYHRSHRDDPATKRSRASSRSPPARRDGKVRPRSPPRGPREAPAGRPETNGSAHKGGPPQPSSTTPATLKADLKRADADKMQIDEGKGSDDDSDSQLRKVMGFLNFRSTKNTKVPGNDKSYGVRKESKTTYRQYMNRVGGFNRPLSPS